MDRVVPVAGEAERLYREHRRLLLYVAARKFGVPDADAEALLQETMIAFLTTNTRIDDPKAWLVATMCNLSRRYWRSRIRTDDIEGGALWDGAEAAPDFNLDRIERELVVQRVLSQLRTRDREVLRLRYFEQLTARVIAGMLGTTLGYAEKRIRVALRRARDAYVRLHAAGGAVGTHPAAKAVDTGELREIGDRCDGHSFVTPIPLLRGVTDRHISLPTESQNVPEYELPHSKNSEMPLICVVDEHAAHRVHCPSFRKKTHFACTSGGHS